MIPFKCIRNPTTLLFHDFAAEGRTMLRLVGPEYRSQQRSTSISKNADFSFLLRQLDF